MIFPSSMALITIQSLVNKVFTSTSTTMMQYPISYRIYSSESYTVSFSYLEDQDRKIKLLYKITDLCELFVLMLHNIIPSQWLHLKS